MMELVERFKFWRRVLARQETFLTNDTGEHVSIDGYNLFTDTITYRVGEFGYYSIGSERTMDRKRFLAFGAKGWRVV